MRFLLALAATFAALTLVVPDVTAKGGGKGGGHSSRGHSSSHSKVTSPSRSGSSHSSGKSSASKGSATTHRSSSPGPGTGSRNQPVNVKGYARKDGTRVEAHKRSTPDKNFNNNWSTKGNANPYTGKQGTQNPPTK